MTLTDAPSVLDLVRLDPQERPPSDQGLAHELRARLVAGPLPPDRLDLRAPRDASSAPASALGRLRGIGVHQLVRLAGVGYDWRDPARDALRAWREDGAGDLAAEFDGLDPEERAALLADLDAHAVMLRRALGPIAPGWMARTALRARVVLAEGRVILHDVVDLMLGIVGERASVALIDVTSAPLGDDAEDRVAYHALCQCVRTSHAPLASAIVSTATGDVLHRRVDADLLERAVAHVREQIEAAP